MLCVCVWSLTDSFLPNQKNAEMNNFSNRSEWSCDLSARYPAFLPLENKVILMRMFLLIHIPSGRTRASLSPGARGVGFKRKKKTRTHLFFRRSLTRMAWGGGRWGGRCVHTATTRPALGSLPARTQPSCKRGAARCRSINR